MSDLVVAAAEPILAANSIPQVIDNLRVWIMSIIAAVATLFAVVGGLRWMTAGADPSKIEQAKENFASALKGYALAVLAPVLLQVLQGIIGG